MTDEKIIEALECCARYENYLACRGCPFSESGVCEEDGLALQKYSLDLIKRQQAEIVFLKAENEGVKKACDILNARNKKPMDVAIKEFAERLKEAFPQTDRNNICPALYYDDYCYIIDELAEEMTEEEGGKG